MKFSYSGKTATGGRLYCKTDESTAKRQAVKWAAARGEAYGVFQAKNGEWWHAPMSYIRQSKPAYVPGTLREYQPGATISMLQRSR